MKSLPRITNKIFKATIVSLVTFGFLWVSTPSSLAALAGTWQYPLKGPWDVSFGFGATYNGKYHLADDELDPAGTPVYAPANGKVVRIENWPSCGNYGGLVLIEVTNYDGSKVVALNGHMIGATIAVTEGQQVSRGQVIGYLGNYSQNGCWEEHVHFGISKGAYQESPWKYWGYGDKNMLNDWENPSLYVPARQQFVEVKRIPKASPDRYQTAVGVSQREYPQNNSVDNVLVASGTVHVDGLAAAPLTKALRAPLLLTKKNELPTSTQNEIKRVLKSQGTVYLLGGSATINPTLENQIKSWGYKTKRIAGNDREGTALAAASYLNKADTAFVAHRSTFPDAISAGGPATQFEDPILLTKPDTLSIATKDYLAKNGNLKRVVVMGGPASISNEALNEIKNIRKDLIVWRVGGTDRYATNIKLNQQFIKNPSKVVMATGQDYPDALSGGSLAATEQAALIIAKKNQLPSDLSNYLDPVKSNFKESLVLGGEAALTEQVRVQLVNLLNSPITATASSTRQDTTALNGSVSPDSPATTVKEPRSTASLKSATWLGANAQPTSTLAMPVPTKYRADDLTYRGAQVTMLKNNLDRQEFSPLIINKLPIEPGQNVSQVLASWYGVDTNNIKASPITSELFLLDQLPGLVPTRAAYFRSGHDLYLIESRLQNKTLDLNLIRKIYNTNHL